jgi:hypothetical protein
MITIDTTGIAAAIALNNITHNMAFGVVVNVRYEFEEADEPPVYGDSWDEEFDVPGVYVDLEIKANDDDGELIYAVRSPLVCAGEPLSARWGNPLGTQSFRSVAKAFRRSEGLTYALADAVGWAREQVAVIEGVIESRASRMVEREATIAFVLRG